MSAITGPIARLKTLFTGLVSDTVVDPNDGSSLGTRTIQRIWSATPQQPQPEDFPGIVLEMSPEEEFRFGIEAIGTPGLARLYYPIQILVLVGVPATADVGLLHNLASAWVVPVSSKIGSDITLGGTVTQMGERGSKDIFTGRINSYTWNQATFYALIGKLWVTEKPQVTLG